MENLPSELYGVSRGRPVNPDTDCNCRKHITLGKGIYQSTNDNFQKKTE